MMSIPSVESLGRCLHTLSLMLEASEAANANSGGDSQHDLTVSHPLRCIMTHLQILGYVNRVRDVSACVDNSEFTMAQVESNAVRCPDANAAEQMYSGPLPPRFPAAPLLGDLVPACARKASFSRSCLCSHRRDSKAWRLLRRRGDMCRPESADRSWLACLRQTRGRIGEGVHVAASLEGLQPLLFPAPSSRALTRSTRCCLQIRIASVPCTCSRALSCSLRRLPSCEHQSWTALGLALTSPVRAHGIACRLLVAVCDACSRMSRESLLQVYSLVVHVLQGFEIGSGFAGSRMLGSEHNDEFYMQNGTVRTRTNRCVFSLSLKTVSFESSTPAFSVDTASSVTDLRHASLAIRAAIVCLHCVFTEAATCHPCSSLNQGTHQLRQEPHTSPRRQQNQPSAVS